MSQRIKAARMASGLSVHKASELVGVSPATYIAREKDDGRFTLDELKKLSGGMDDSGMSLLNRAIDLFFDLEY